MPETAMTAPILRHQRGIFVFEGEYHHKYIAKDVGFSWHIIPCNKKTCPVCDAGLEKCWYTTDDIIAGKLIRYADADCRKILDKISREREKAIQKSQAEDMDISIPSPSGLSYLPYQRAGIAFALNKASVLIADEMGLGKTIQALGVINACPDINHVLIVSPASLKINWKREAQKWLVRDLRVEIADSKFIPYFANIVIINYDILGHHRESLREKIWDLIILDEAHYCKNPQAQRSREIYGYKKRKEQIITPIPARRRIALTGTPIENRPEEIWALWHWLDPENCPDRFTFMKNYYDTKREQVYIRGGGGKKRTIWKYGNPRNLHDLQIRLRSTIMIRRKTADVLKELPIKRRQIIELPRNGNDALIQHEIEVYREYKNAVMERRNLEQFSDDYRYRQRLAELKEAEQQSFARLAHIRKELAIAKLPYIFEHLDNVLNETDKVIVFAYHREVIEKLRDHYGDTAVHLYGGMSNVAKQDAVDRFDNDPSVRIFIASILAAGVGLNLTAAAHAVFAEIDYVPGRIEQAEKRPHRLGQDRPVLIQFLLFEESLDSRIARSIVEKMEYIEKSLDQKGIKSETEFKEQTG